MEDCLRDFCRFGYSRTNILRVLRKMKRFFGGTFFFYVLFFGFFDIIGEIEVELIR